MDDDGEIETKGVRARRLATLRKRRQRETDKTEAKRPKTAESHLRTRRNHAHSWPSFSTFSSSELARFTTFHEIEVLPRAYGTTPTEWTCVRLVTAYAYL